MILSLRGSTTSSGIRVGLGCGEEMFLGGEWGRPNPPRLVGRRRSASEQLPVFLLPSAPCSLSEVLAAWCPFDPLAVCGAHRPNELCLHVGQWYLRRPFLCLPSQRPLVVVVATCGCTQAGLFLNHPEVPQALSDLLFMIKSVDIGRLWHSSVHWQPLSAQSCVSACHSTSVYYMQPAIQYCLCVQECT